jgi:N utilization substance protein B
VTDATRAARHAAREAALQMLYQWEIGGADLGETIATYPAVQPRPLDEAARAFAHDLVRGTAVNLPEIDALIAEQAQHWRIERMAVVDRLILRLGVFELRHTTTPLPIIVDEALDLARTFSSEPAVKFINGVLDAIGRRLRGGHAQGGSTAEH